MGYDPNRFWNRPTGRVRECGGHDHLGNSITLSPQDGLTPDVRSGKMHNFSSRAHMDHIIFDKAGIPLSTPEIRGESRRPSMQYQPPSPIGAHVQQQQYGIPAARMQAAAPRAVSFTQQPGMIRNQAGQHADGHVAEAIGSIRAGLRRGGAHGALLLEQALRDSRVRSRSLIGFLPLSQALSALPGVEDKHTHALFRFLDVACAGCIPVEELSDALYGPMRPAQLGLVQAAFEAIRGALGGSMDVSEAVKLFDCKTHPDHLSGAKSKATIIAEFMGAIGGNDLAWPEFQRYYRAVSACVTPDEFECMVTSCWHLDGNTGPRPMPSMSSPRPHSGRAAYSAFETTQMYQHSPEPAHSEQHDYHLPSASHAITHAHSGPQLGASPIYNVGHTASRHLPSERRTGRAMVPENVSFQRSHVEFG